MNQGVQLASLVKQPFELLREIERRSASAQAGGAAAAAGEEWVGVGFRLGDESFVADREQVKEVLMLPETMTRVPGARRWLLGIANLRGHLLPLVDVKLLLGSGRTTLRRTTRVISANHREIPAGLVVEDATFGDMFTGRLPLTTMRIPLSALPGVDFSDIREIALVFDQTETGSLFLADLAWVLPANPARRATMMGPVAYLAAGSRPPVP